MNTRRKIIIKFGLLPAISGCTQRLYQNYTYQENLSEVLISADGKNIVFIGNEFHYIMDAPETIFKLIKSTISKKLITRFEDFEVDANNIIRGMIEITTLDTISDTESDLALSLGFKVLIGKIMRIKIEALPTFQPVSFFRPTSDESALHCINVSH